MQTARNGHDGRRAITVPPFADLPAVFPAPWMQCRSASELELIKLVQPQILSAFELRIQSCRVSRGIAVKRKAQGPQSLGL